MARNMTREEIAKIIQDARVNAGLTQQQAAEAIGRKRQTLASWETGQSQPDANTLFVLCDLYGADINEAFGFTTKKVDLNKHEQALVEAYRNAPDMQAAVDRLLGIEAVTDNARVFRAAHGENSKGGEIVEVPRSTIEKLKAAKPADEI